MCLILKLALNKYHITIIIIVIVIAIAIAITIIISSSSIIIIIIIITIIISLVVLVRPPGWERFYRLPCEFVQHGMFLWYTVMKANLSVFLKLGFVTAGAQPVYQGYSLIPAAA